MRKTLFIRKFHKSSGKVHDKKFFPHRVYIIAHSNRIVNIV